MNRYRKLLIFKGTIEPTFTKAPLPSVKGKWLGKTYDGWNRYEVNNEALVIPAKPIRVSYSYINPLRTEDKRITVENATKEELQSALHAITNRKRWLL